MYLYQNTINYDAANWPGEVIEGPSMTEPDMSLSIPELLDRHSRGLPLPFYEDDYTDLDLPDFGAMDLAEIAEYRERLAEHIEDLQEEQRLAALHHERKDVQTSAVAVSPEPAPSDEPDV